MVIPVPVLGAVVGGLVGGVVGAAVGQVEGILLGEIVEKIDYKIKENNKQSSDTETETTTKSSSSDYNVLKHLVFKFKKDVLKTENLKESSSSSSSSDDLNNEKTKSKFYMKTSGSEINEDDYEIYVLNESRDDEVVVSSLPVDDINLKRKSIESFSADQLPSEMNVYFRYSDLKEKDNN
jgi:hypothetical protein